MQQKRLFDEINKEKVMSILSIAFPASVAVPAAEAFVATAVTVARPLIGLSAVAVLAVVFKPMLIGLLRAALLVLKPRRSSEARELRRQRKSALMLNRMARDLNDTQPGLAAELRWLASRG